jgi:AraC-like DNA-binding protein/quercetin dioxygenase-like cupin family protein
MRCDFTVMDSHLEAPRGPAPAGKLVLSQLKPGSSMIGAPAPSLKVVVDGEERYTIDGRTVTVRPGQFLYLDAGAACIGTNRTTTIGMCLILPPDIALSRRADVAGHDPVLGRALVLSTGASAMGRRLRDYAERIARNPALGGRLAEELAAGVEQAIAEPLAESRAAIEALKAAKADTRRELHRRLERARGFLHDNAGRSVSLSEMADVAGLSQFHLARYFKLAFGEAPIAYHRGLRLSRAAAFLGEGAGSLAEAAELTGYSDSVALSHAFRKHYGQPPQQWAMRLRG